MKSVLQSMGVACLAWCAASLASAQESPAPQIVLSQDVWDFGEVWQEERPVFKLTIRNEGNAELRLGKVRTT